VTCAAKALLCVEWRCLEGSKVFVYERLTNKGCCGRRGDVGDCAMSPVVL
jgi:hypothetical protein